MKNETERVEELRLSIEQKKQALDTALGDLKEAASRPVGLGYWISSDAWGWAAMAGLLGLWAGLKSDK